MIRFPFSYLSNAFSTSSLPSACFREHKSAFRFFLMFWPFFRNLSCYSFVSEKQWSTGHPYRSVTFFDTAYPAAGSWVQVYKLFQVFCWLFDLLSDSHFHRSTFQAFGPFFLASQWVTPVSDIKFRSIFFLTKVWNIDKWNNVKFWHPTIEIIYLGDERERNTI